MVTLLRLPPPYDFVCCYPSSPIYTRSFAIIPCLNISTQIRYGRGIETRTAERVRNEVVDH
jgi:hypothetical protein